MLDEDVEFEELFRVIDQERSMSYYKENILAYIGGFIVRRLLEKLNCQECAAALLEKENILAYHNSLTNLKNRGGLVIPSIDVVRILKKCEAFFRVYVSGCTGDLQISCVKNIKGILANKIQRELFSDGLFRSLLNHDYENCFITEDLHSTQLTKKIIDYFLRIRFFRYGQRYSSEMKKSKHGLRQQLNKSVLFQGL